MKNQFFVDIGGKTVGPATIQQLEAWKRSGEISDETLVSYDGADAWIPLAEILKRFEFFSPSPPPIPQKRDLSASRGGWICFVIAAALIFLPAPTVFIYAPLLLVSFILGIVAIAQSQVRAGIYLILVNLTLAPVLCIFGIGMFASTTAGILSSVLHRHPTVIQSSPAMAAAPATPISPLDAKNGFREFKLGTPLSEMRSIERLTATYPRPEIKLFRPTHFDPALGDFQLSDITLVFEDDILKNCTITAEGAENVAGLKASLIAAFGEPSKNSFSDDLTWSGTNVHLNFSTSSFYKKSAKAAFTSSSVDAAIAAAREARAKAGAKKAATSL